MKYILTILISLFLFGCTSETQLRDMEILKLKVRSLELTIDDINNKSFSKPGSSSPECVFYSKCGDSHGIVSVTIPITSWYYINSYGKEASVRYLISGQVIHGVIDLVRDTCQNYEKLKGSIK